jgi:hypothetical protein
MNLRDEMTHLGGGNRPQTQEPFDLSLLNPGDTVEIKTASGSSYWLTPGRGFYCSGSTVYIVSVVSSSATFGQVTRSPSRSSAAKLVRIGYRFKINDTQTNVVVSVQRA